MSTFPWLTVTMAIPAAGALVLAVMPAPRPATGRRRPPAADRPTAGAALRNELAKGSRWCSRW